MLVWLVCEFLYDYQFHYHNQLSKESNNCYRKVINDVVV